MTHASAGGTSDTASGQTSSESSSKSGSGGGNPTTGQSGSRHLVLAVLAAFTTCLYGAISWLSWRFDYDSVVTDRPIIAVLCLFALSFAAYLVAIRLVATSAAEGEVVESGVGSRATENRRTLKLLIATAVLFRVVMLFSLPIQEVDIYRYLWDGAVTTAGVSPFQYSPQHVSSVNLGSTSDSRLERLAVIRDRDPAMAEILRRVHFPELPTIYPPTSQAVFAAANLTTPANASLLTRVFIMKAWFVGFDIATLFVVIALLRLYSKPPSLCVIYGWCPLLMKEVANSGHLDAVAVFFTTLAVYLVARFLVKTTNPPRMSRSSIAHLGLIGLILGGAVGAKLYPIILAPLFFFAIAGKLGWRIALFPAAVLVISTALLVSPMFVGDKASPDQQLQSDPSLGVVTFLRRWEMNDYIFLLVIENVRPTADRGPHERAWFTVVPESARESIVNLVSSRLNIHAREVPFLLTRALTAIAFFLTAMFIAFRIAAKDASRFCEGAFLTIAWFWLLCPTQNPWYWTWALPLLAFARSRMWLAVSGLVLVYYLRFWLGYHFPATAVLGSPYTGSAFYDFIVTWIEFAPWFGLLAIGFMLPRKISRHFVMSHYGCESE